MSPAEVVYTVSMILLTGALLLFAKSMYTLLSGFDVNHIESKKERALDFVPSLLAFHHHCSN